MQPRVTARRWFGGGRRAGASVADRQLRSGALCAVVDGLYPSGDCGVGVRKRDRYIYGDAFGGDHARRYFISLKQIPTKLLQIRNLIIPCGHQGQYGDPISELI